MKILYDPRNSEKPKVIEECKTCPCCGENKSRYMMYGGSVNGISIIRERQVLRTPLEIIRDMMYNNSETYVSEFKCNTCGALYESDPYRK